MITQEQKESEAARQLRLKAARDSNKPLFEQLAEQADKKQAEYDANTKLLFAPPKAIDEEEFAFLSAVEEGERRRRQAREGHDNSAVEQFREAQKAMTSTPTAAAASMLAPALAPPAVVAAVTALKIKPSIGTISVSVSLLNLRAACQHICNNMYSDKTEEETRCTLLLANLSTSTLRDYT